MRRNGREANQLRPVTITRHYTKYAEGSVLVAYGDTKVICNASITDGVPAFLRGEDKGWLTAEYSMLPRATQERCMREAARGKQDGRTLEIQRLLGRSLRTVVDLKQLQGYTLVVDCDVLQADGGTRTASITGACVAIADALAKLQQKTKKNYSLQQFIAAVSVGICNGAPVLDLDYAEDSHAQTDMNVVMTADGKFIEIQGTAEKRSFSAEELHAMLNLAKHGIAQLLELQQQALHTITS